MEFINPHLQDQIRSYLRDQKELCTPKNPISENSLKSNELKFEQNSQKIPKEPIFEITLETNKLKNEYSSMQRAFEISKKKVEEYQINLSKIKTELQNASVSENKMVEKINNIKEPSVIYFSNFDEQLNKILLSIEDLQNSKESKHSELTIEKLKEEINNLRKEIVDIYEEFMFKMISLNDCYTTYKNRESTLKERTVQESSSQKGKKPQLQDTSKINPQKEILQESKSSEKNKLFQLRALPFLLRIKHLK